jgi:hypothetical protein
MPTNYDPEFYRGDSSPPDGDSDTETCLSERTALVFKESIAFARVKELLKEVNDADSVTSDLSMTQEASVTKGKRIRRTKMQISLENETKRSKTASAVALTEVSSMKTTGTSKERESPQANEGTITLSNNKTYALMPPRSLWTNEECASLVAVMTKWTADCDNSQNCRLMSQNRVWLEEIPKRMGQSFGKVRPCPDGKFANSPYKSKWADIKKKVSDLKQ